MVLQGSQCNRGSPFQSVCVNVLQSALVPGSIFNNTPKPRRSSWLFFFFLIYWRVPGRRCGYHSNDTISAPNDAGLCAY
ncbi:hypothetical protein AOQ84DRAFT_172698 [Glonium stellatum]|uniref:Uncharacterized protein n=1 Tax=Glonium stellatum TaxID=574774 RepID=A0A8E2EQV5_9PEZI|nr:hypothetical protein AOQ84DRAFT_172698 [Glonium stellatum]